MDLKPSQNQDEDYMALALDLAKEAFAKNEVPIGAVLVQKNKVLAKTANGNELLKNPLKHAEMLAIEASCQKLQNWRLQNCTMYVTLEPCLMCLGALFQARVSRLVFGCYDLRRKSDASFFGSLSAYDNHTLLNLHNHNLEIVGGVLENECSEILKRFFKEKRK